MKNGALEEVHSYLQKNPKLKLIAVSKFQPVEAIRRLASEGVSRFGENYLQEAIDKQKKLKDLNLEWHFIGKIQSNKAKDLVGKFEYIHSVDRLKVAEKLNTAALSLGIRQKILIEVNLAAEESKGGVPPDELEVFVQSLNKLTSLEVCGLMVMPPLAENPEDVRPYFKTARNILNKLSQKKKSFQELSMGTSQDFRVAIEEGSTMIRVGTLIFGPRPSVNSKK